MVETQAGKTDRGTVQATLWCFVIYIVIGDIAVVVDHDGARLDQIRFLLFCTIYKIIILTTFTKITSN